MAFIADVKVSLYSSQVDVTVTSETLSVYNVLPPFCREGGGGGCQKSSILAKGRLAPFQFLGGDLVKKGEWNFSRGAEYFLKVIFNY